MEIVKNKVQLTGKIGKLCDFKKLDSGATLARISLSITESYHKANGEMVYNTEWHNLFAWGKLAEEMEIECETGSRISIEGKLVSRSYLAKDGQKKYVTEVKVMAFQVLEKTKAMEHLH